jgi:Sulfotransferase family
MRNVLITGMPRSGTTLVCSLLNKLPDVVALHEPMNVWEFANCRSGDEIGAMVETFCGESRKSLLEKGFAVSKHVGGKVRDNSTVVDRAGKRSRQTEHGRIEIDKPLSKEFTLAIKHPAAFTALIETLSKHFECFAIIRNPLATLASWNSLDWFPLKDGHLPVGEKLDVDLARDLAKIADGLDRQIHILE